MRILSLFEIMRLQTIADNDKNDLIQIRGHAQDQIEKAVDDFNKIDQAIRIARTQSAYDMASRRLIVTIIEIEKTNDAPLAEFADRIIAIIEAAEVNLRTMLRMRFDNGSGINVTFSFGLCEA